MKVLTGVMHPVPQASKCYTRDGTQANEKQTHEVTAGLGAYMVCGTQTPKAPGFTLLGRPPSTEGETEACGAGSSRRLKAARHNRATVRDERGGCF